MGYVFGFHWSSVAHFRLIPPINGVPTRAGIRPSAIVADPAGSYLFVTDAGRNNVLGFNLSSAALTPIAGSPYPAGNQPSAVIVESKGLYAYVANGQDSTITAYTLSSGILSRIGTYTTGAQPVAIGIDPSLNEFLYTANFLGNSVSGFQIQASDLGLISQLPRARPSKPMPTPPPWPPFYTTEGHVGGPPAQALRRASRKFSLPIGLLQSIRNN